MSPSDLEQDISIRVIQAHGESIRLPSTLRIMTPAGDPIAALDREDGEFTVSLPLGDYLVEAETGNRLSPRQPVAVGLDRSPELIVAVGEAGWPTYRMGSSVVPFEPRPTIVAIVPDGRSDDDDAVDIASVLAESGLMPVGDDDGPSDEDAATRGSSGIRLFTGAGDDDARTPSREELRQALGGRARIGMPVDTRPGMRKVIDNRFIVRFENDVDEADVRERLARAGATVNRKFPQASNTWLIVFEHGEPLDHLEQIERWHDENLLVYGEPDLISEASDDVFPYTAPDDPTYANQANLTLQNVDEAWRRLAEIDPLIAAGSPRVHVASLDRGIDIDHPDLGARLSDGTEQMARCFDFDGMRECTVPGYAPDSDHGMGVYGIIAAATDNDNDIAGVAPNAHHIGLERPAAIGTADYADVLMWAAGMTTGNTRAGWPAEPLPAGADIISCSHGSGGTALSGLMDDTFKILDRDGRGGLGTVIVYSAGNDNMLVTGWRTWAAHPVTIAVANSARPDAAGVERKVFDSNFGPEIDVCAQGAGAPSLDASGGEQGFGGTSAAAPTVAAIAALILSANPTLTARQVRDVLRQTAVRIDPANTDPVGRWVGDFSQWYGYGRVDAAAAVALATMTGGRPDTDFDGDGSAEIPVTSPWGMGLLGYDGVGLDAMAMIPNGTRVGDWLLDTAHDRLDVMADLDGDGRSELLISSPWGVGVLKADTMGYAQSMIARNGTRFGEWLLDTGNNRLGPVGDFDGDGRDEVLVTSPWGMATLRLDGDTFTPTAMAGNGNRFGEWLLNTADNRFGPVGDFDGDGKDEIMVSSPWGLAILKREGDRLSTLSMARNGTRFGGWLLDTADNRLGPVGDFDGDGQDEVVISSPWGMAILKLDRATLAPVVMAANGTRFGGWLLNTADNRLRAVADFEGTGAADLFITSPWGIGSVFLNGSELDARAMARNGTRLGEWLLNTDDNKFSRFSDMTGDGRADILLASPWGVGIMSPRGDTFEVPFLARNGTRFGGWLLDTADNVL